MSISLGALSSVNSLIGKAFKQPKGDFAERLNSRITVAILALCSVLLGSSHFWGDPITCWTPAQFTKQWSDFVNQYCYVHGTYFVPLDQELTHDETERRKNEINYYQWVPYILALQALLFYIPRFMWSSLANHSGYDLGGAIRYVDDFWNSVKNNDGAFKARIAAFEGRPAVFIWEGLRLARRKSGRDLSTYYAASTWYWLNGFLQSTTYAFWGPNVLVDLFQGEDWQTTGHFPRIVHCDFQRRRPASVQLDTVLCVLHLNIYYEKICLFLWFWLLFVAIVSTWNSLSWIINIVMWTNARKKVRDLLSCSTEANSAPSKERFFRALGKDGLFVIQHMALNLGDIPTSYLTAAMRNCCDQFEEEEEEDRYLINPAPKAV
ncbi:inx-6 [Pristionchus pacificus]|uniref:Innexin n=1 Tax=Pristionchus pacificus TaxID=54126 RepID=A0A2A6CAU1_PRIPA|nr:inx-6 [Pristionchus pacificus]|eukprot:PDM75237.1 inx-6 [Pristionchus pacificus]